MIKFIIRTIRDKLKNLTRSGKKKPAIESDGSITSDEQKLKETGESPLEPPKKKKRRKKKSISKSKPAPALTMDDWDVSQYDVPVQEGKTRFHDLDIPLELMRAVFDAGFQYCTPIQAEIMPFTLAGRDATGRAQTGTGKTAAFLLTIYTHFLRHPITGDRPAGTPRALILSPTRELALQITKDAEDLSKYCPFKIVTLFGGMDYEKQRRQLGTPIDVIIATPGRLMDFQQQRDVHLDRVEVMVIDEADRMLDMGFIPHVRRIIHSTPPKQDRQTLLFSATLTPDIIRLASQWTTDPISVEIVPEQVEVDSVDQMVYIVTAKEKYALLYNIISRQNLERVLIFCNRRDETKRLANLLTRYNIQCDVMSGDVDQRKRIRTLEDFRAGKIRVLVATDVAGRGLHVEGISHVINYTLPNDPEDYVHRIGRTGRAGASGISVSFASEDDSFQIPAIEAFLGHELPCIHPEDDWLILPPVPESTPENTPKKTSESHPRGKRKPRSGGSYAKKPYRK